MSRGFQKVRLGAQTQTVGPLWRKHFLLWPHWPACEKGVKVSPVEEGFSQLTRVQLCVLSGPEMRPFPSNSVFRVKGHQDKKESL